MVCPLPAGSSASEPDPADLTTLKRAGLSDQGPALLKFFRDRTPPGLGPDTIPALIKQLGSPNFAVRERASADLVKLGPAAAPLLKAASRGKDPEVAGRARQCLLRLARGIDPDVSWAAVRVLACRKPPGTAATLLAFSPLADNPFVSEEVISALAAVAYPQGKPDNALTDALGDKWALKRAVAAEALARGGSAEQRRALAPLLKDRDVRVRLAVARALVVDGVRAAVPVLIDALAEGQAEQVWQAEELLQRLAGDAAPAGPKEADAPARKKYRDAWAAWWQRNAAKVDLGLLKRGQGTLGYVLALESAGGVTQVMELDRSGKTRWRFEVKGPVSDARVVPPNRVLLAEPGKGRVTERTFNGRIVWQTAADLPVSCQRLRNGNTFIACGRGELREVGRDGKLLASTTYHPKADLQLARRLPNGYTVVLAMGGRLAQLDPEGTATRTASVYDRHPYRIVCDVLPSGRLLMPQTQDDKVVEYDGGGRVVWAASLRRGDLPSAVLRLPGGNTLVYCSGTLVELDRTGKEVSRRPGGSRLPLAFR
jgi:HEAT repeat protein